MIKAFKSIFIRLGAMLMGVLAELVKDIPFLNVLYGPLTDAKEYLDGLAEETLGDFILTGENVTQAATTGYGWY